MEIVFIAIPQNPDRQSVIQTGAMRKEYAPLQGRTELRFAMPSRINTQWKMQVEYYVARHLKKQQDVSVSVEGKTYILPYKNAYTFVKALSQCILTGRKDNKTKIENTHKEWVKHS